MPTDPPPAVENERVDLEAIMARVAKAASWPEWVYCLIPDQLVFAEDGCSIEEREVGWVNGLETLGNGGEGFMLPEVAQYVAHSRSDIPALLREVARLQGIVGKLPQTADGVPVTPGMRLWRIFGNDIRQNVLMSNQWPACLCYSTRESALAALRAHPGAEGKESESK